MKKNVSVLLALILCLSFAVPTFAAGTETNNINRQNYGTWASTVKSYLFENPDGDLTRVEFYNGEIIVEDYDKSLTLQNSRSIPMELSVWGGFFAGDDYNYFVFGQNNLNEDNNVEVVRVVKYSKDWRRLGAASLCGANTTTIFDGGSLRCAEYGGYLYIRTCHEMYRASDGYCHQANLTMTVRESDMTLTDSFYKVANKGVGYVSHSFNQFVLIDQNQDIVTMDHGDAYPREIVLMKYKQSKGGGSTFSGQTTCTSVVELQGAIGQNSTGASAGGLAEISNGYVAAYSDNGSGTGSDNRHIYLAYVSRNGEVTKKQVSKESGNFTPVLVPVGLNGGYIMWSREGMLWYSAYDADGKISEVKTANASLSDCQPIVYDGKLVWYVTKNSKPVFYTLDDSGVSSIDNPSAVEPSDPAPTPSVVEPGTPTPTPSVVEPSDPAPSPSVTPVTPQFTDIKKSDFFYDSVMWAVENNITSGISATTFSPNNPCDRGQIVTFLWRASGSPEPASLNNPFVDVKSGDYYYKAVLWAKEKGITSGMDATHFSPSTPCTRSQAVTFLWRANDEPTGTGKGFSDVKSEEFYADAVKWATGKNIASGTSSTTFSPEQTCTRGQIVTFLYRDKSNQ